jgi:alpha-ribazole phosphatase
MIVDLLRHGEPSGGERFRGNGVDDPLNEQGWRQMWQSVGDSLNWPWEAVLTSPMQRCVSFAEALCTRKPTPMRVIQDLQEIGFGAWEGCSREEITTQHAAEYAAFYADPVTNRPAGAEPLTDFRQRVEGALRDEIALCQKEQVERMLIVTHAGVIRAAIGWVLDMPDAALYRLDCEHASLTQIRHDARRGWRLHFSNCRSG